MKQLQSRLKKRNQEEEKRQERAERAKTARWEEHQRQVPDSGSGSTTTRLSFEYRSTNRYTVQIQFISSF